MASGRSRRARATAQVGNWRSRALMVSRRRGGGTGASPALEIGGMRDLDRLATGCLREAARKKRKLVERDLLPCVLDRDGLEHAG